MERICGKCRFVRKEIVKECDIKNVYFQHYISTFYYKKCDISTFNNILFCAYCGFALWSSVFAFHVTERCQIISV